MIWFDIVTPKSASFFDPVIRELKDRGEKIFVTSRYSEGYSELTKLLDRLGLDYNLCGAYGGEDLKNKLEGSIKRQLALFNLVQDKKIDKMVSLCSVDASRVAFGLGMQIINFCDFPSKSHDALPVLTHVARLTLPISDKIAHPFVVPDKIFKKFVKPQNILTYHFIDPILYLREQTQEKEYFCNLPIDKRKKTIAFREEEYKASYVGEKFEYVYDVLKSLDCNLIVLPRYETTHLKKVFKHAVIIEDAPALSKILPFVDLFIGGGGTINIEACYWGVPTISTRSFVCHYDNYLIEKGLMRRAVNANQLRKEIQSLTGKKASDNVLRNQRVDIEGIVDFITDGIHTGKGRAKGSK